MIIFNVSYAPAHQGAWSVDVSTGQFQFKCRQDALRFAVKEALKSEQDGEAALIAIEGVDGQWRVFDHQARGVVA